MRPEPASEQTTAPKVVLILADRAIGEKLSSQFQGLGFDTRVQLPPPFCAPTQELRELLAGFAQVEARHSLWFHPGISPLAEKTEWLALCRELGVQAILPPPRSLSHFNNRLSLLSEGEKVSTPNLLISGDPLHSVREIERLVRSKKLTFPFVLKSVRGGSGLGVKVIQQPEDLGRSLGLWLEQIRRNFGESMVLAERYLEGARRVVQPFARFMDGTFRLFPTVEASLASRLRKIVEFSPAYDDPRVEKSQLKQIGGWTEALAHRTGYVGVGAVEYLLDGDRAYLIEGVPRLNSSFPVWEAVAGTSAIGWQLATLRSESQSSAPQMMERTQWCAGLGLRILAEDPLLQLPQPGKIAETSSKTEWNFPGASAQVSLNFGEGEEIRPEQLSAVVGYIWTWAEDRKRAMLVARGVLSEIWIAGSLQTNERYLQELLVHPWVQEGMFHASFVDEEFIPAVRAEEQVLQAALVAAQALFQTLKASSEISGVKWAVGDQWIKPTKSLENLEWEKELSVFDREGVPTVSGVLKLRTGRSCRVFGYPLAENRWQVRIGNWFLPVRRALPRAEAGGASLRLVALISGKVHSLLFREGSWVPAHEAALVVESLGSLIPHALPLDVRIVKWHVAAEEKVQIGQLLAEFERAPQVR